MASLGQDTPNEVHVPTNGLTPLQKLEDLLSEAKRRPFDDYILGPFMVWYGLRSKMMPKLARKLMIAGGIWQLYYSWNKFRTLPEDIKNIPGKVSQIVDGSKLIG